LLGQLDGALEITQRADLVGAALGDDVRLAAAAADVLGDSLEGDGIALELLVGEIADLGAEHPVQEEVAVVGGGTLPLHRDDGPQPEPRGHGRDRAAAVGLERADGDEGVGALRQGVADQELELADLVAGLQQARQIVALHVQLDAQTARQALELHDGRGRQGKLDARRRVHALILSLPSPRLVMDQLSSRLAASPLSSNRNACGIHSALGS
jgi:hypothetical protein